MFARYRPTFVRVSRSFLSPTRNTSILALLKDKPLIEEISDIANNPVSLRADAPHVLICGGGLGGLSSAVHLALRGFEVTVFDKASKLRALSGGRMSVMPNGQFALAAIGFGNQLEKIARHNGRFHYRWFDDEPIFTFEFGKEIEELGLPNNVDILRCDMQNMFLDALELFPNVQVIEGNGLEDITQTDEKVTAHLTDGKQLTGDILLGADGVKSHVRTLLFGEIQPIYSGSLLYYGHTPLEKAHKHHQETNCLRFLISPEGTGLNFSIVVRDKLHWGCCVDKPDPWGDKTAGSSLADVAGDETIDGESWKEIREQKILDEIREMSAEWGDIPFRQNIENCAVLSKLGMYTRPTMETWHKGRVLLTGDAAHAALVFAGQGGNMAFEDTWRLGKIFGLSNITKMSSTEDWEALFSEFYDERFAKCCGVLEAGFNGRNLYMSTEPQFMEARKNLVPLVTQFWRNGIDSFCKYKL